MHAKQLEAISLIFTTIQPLHAAPWPFVFSPLSPRSLRLRVAPWVSLASLVAASALHLRPAPAAPTRRDTASGLAPAPRPDPSLPSDPRRPRLSSRPRPPAGPPPAPHRLGHANDKYATASARWQFAGRPNDAIRTDRVPTGSQFTRHGAMSGSPQPQPQSPPAPAGIVGDGKGTADRRIAHRGLLVFGRKEEGKFEIRVRRLIVFKGVQMTTFW